MHKPRQDYYIKVENLTEGEFSTVIRLLHSTGYVSSASATLERQVTELEAIRARFLRLADQMERESPKPDVGGFLAEEIRLIANGGRRP